MKFGHKTDRLSERAKQLELHFDDQDIGGAIAYGDHRRSDPLAVYSNWFLPMAIARRFEPNVH